MMNWTPDTIAYAQRLYDDGMRPSKIAERLWATHRLTTGPKELRTKINVHRSFARMTPELREKIRALRAKEWISYSLIAERLGVQTCTVEWACRGMRPPEGMKTYGRRSAPGQGARNDLAPKGKIAFPKPVDVPIPVWVPDRLHDLYASIAERDCEEQAAIVCRRLKHGASVAYL